ASALATPPATAADLSDYQQVLIEHVDARGRVDYAAVSTSALGEFVDELESTPEPANRTARMAFWINAYNALTIDLVADNYPLSSIKELDGGDPWSARIFTVAGQQVTLNDIEHKILRRMGDPRVHAALNCASMGCPPLLTVAFTEANLDDQLDRASLVWLSTNGVHVHQDSNAVQLSKIFEWYGQDFMTSHHHDIPGIDGHEEAALNFAAEHLPTHAGFLQGGGYAVMYAKYDWSLNSQP
ncbi:MAG: DUF547 domain-containing protein, partial [Myxococcota bacterium]